MKMTHEKKFSHKEKRNEVWKKINPENGELDLNNEELMSETAALMYKQFEVDERNVLKVRPENIITFGSRKWENAANKNQIASCDDLLEKSIQKNSLHPSDKEKTLISNDNFRVDYKPAADSFEVQNNVGNNKSKTYATTKAHNFEQSTEAIALTLKCSLSLKQSIDLNGQLQSSDLEDFIQNNTDKEIADILGNFTEYLEHL